MNTWSRYMTPLVILLVALVSVPIHAQAPQYFTCYGFPPSNMSHVIVWLRLSNVTTSNGLLYLLDQMYYNPSSPYFHMFITPQEFASWYSPPNYVFTYIENLAVQYGLVVNYTFPMLIEATGNVSAADNFLTALQSAPANITQWILAGECIPIGYFYVNSKLPQYSPAVVKEPLPPGITPQYLLQHAVRINGKPAYVPLTALTPYIPSLQHIGFGHNYAVVHGPLMPAQQEWGYVAAPWFPFGLEWMYDELPLIYSGHYGQGYTIAIVDAFGDFNFALASQYVYQSVACNDLATFDAIFSLPPPSSCQVIYPTGVPILTQYNLPIAVGWAWESALDIEYAHTMAPGANILLVISPDSGDDLYVDIEYVVNNSLANFISLSWGAYEDMFYYPPPAYNLLYAYDEIFMQAAAEGIGVFAASGDSGAFDTGWLSLNMPMEASVLNPASDPWITGVGGTELYVQFINGITQRMETAWNWNPFPYMWGSGGGYSFTFNETPGQALISIPYELQYVYEPNLGIWFSTVGHRGVPDIAADADPFTGVLIVLNGVIPPYFIGGTSLATPLSAGMTTTVQSAVPMFTIGDLAPNLYLIYHYMPSEAYVSITNVTGLESSSFFTGIPGAMFPTLGGDNGLYWAVPGMWNPAAGLGQINVYGLAQALNSLANK